MCAHDHLNYTPSNTVTVVYSHQSPAPDRYLAEFQSAEDRKTSASHALDAYKSASDLANQDLPPTHPIRLGLALNFSVFYYEILNSPERACNLAKAVSLRWSRLCKHTRTHSNAVCISFAICVSSVARGTGMQERACGVNVYFSDVKDASRSGRTVLDA